MSSSVIWNMVICAVWIHNSVVFCLTSKWFSSSCILILSCHILFIFNFPCLFFSISPKYSFYFPFNFFEWIEFYVVMKLETHSQFSLDSFFYLPYVRRKCIVNYTVYQCNLPLLLFDCTARNWVDNFKTQTSFHRSFTGFLAPATLVFKYSQWLWGTIVRWLLMLLYTSDVKVNTY